MALSKFCGAVNTDRISQAGGSPEFATQQRHDRLGCTFLECINRSLETGLRNYEAAAPDFWKLESLVSAVLTYIIIVTYTLVESYSGNPVLVPSVTSLL